MLGMYLKKYRLDNNLTQAEMAKRLNTSQTYYSMIETEFRKPGIQMVNRIAVALNVEPSVVRKML